MSQPGLQLSGFLPSAQRQISWRWFSSHARAWSFSEACVEVNPSQSESSRSRV
jgi:hypothetical protein